MSSPPGQFDPPSAKKGKPEPVQPIKGLVIPAGTKANPQPVVRHMPFSSSAAGVCPAYSLAIRPRSANDLLGQRP